MKNTELLFTPEYESCVENYQLKGEIMHNKYLTPTSKLMYCYFQTHSKGKSFDF